MIMSTSAIILVLIVLLGGGIAVAGMMQSRPADAVLGLSLGSLGLAGLLLLYALLQRGDNRG